MDYELRLASTASGVGYFGCVPARPASFDENLARLRSAPLDDFLHKELLEMISGLDAASLEQILDMAQGRDPVMETLICEATLSVDALAGLRDRFPPERMRALMPWSPLILMKSALLEDQALHNAWTRIFEANLAHHQELPSPDAAGLPMLSYEGNGDRAGSVHIETVVKGLPVAEGAPTVLPTAAETAHRALDRLQALDLFATDETPHASSLSPYGFLRRWKLDISVRFGRHDYTVRGVQTSYGKGLTPDAARASYAMEMVERVSSFASIGPEGVLGRTRPMPVFCAPYRELRGDGREALDPNGLRLEVPYENEPLHWLEAVRCTAEGERAVLVPVQAVFLFCNLDEVSLFSGLGSTGLASGNTVEQARVSGLLEVIERDCEATTLYDPAGCFRLDADDPELRALLADYRAKEVHVAFQDLTTPMGVPCFKCFVVDGGGHVVKGTGAHLDAKRALLSALTETPYGYPQSLPSLPGPEALPVRRFEDFPDYGTGNPARDLRILEGLLCANGYRPHYIDLTREDLALPVVKAIVPGLEWMADFDRYSRVSLRLFQNYLEAFHRR